MTSPAILTNMAFGQSTVWREATTTICRERESPDDLGSLRQVFRLLQLRSQYDVVVVMGPRPALLYGLCCALLGLESKLIMTEVFLDYVRPGSLLWRIKTSLFRLIARRSIGVLTNSSGEVPLIARRFGLSEDRLRFVPMYTTIPDPGMRDTFDGSVVSIGRTLRDLDTLMKAAPRIPADVVVVAARHDPMPHSLPGNVRVLRDIPLEQTHELLARASVAVAPLLPADRSTGQVFFFEAMAMGKPVVVTRSLGSTDYIHHEENGLLVEPENPRDLADAVNRLLTDSAFARKLAETALEDIRSRWMPDHHARHKLQALHELWSARHAASLPRHD